jgi:hypothetical protein
VERGIAHGYSVVVVVARHHLHASAGWSLSRPVRA